MESGTWSDEHTGTTYLSPFVKASEGDKRLVTHVVVVYDDLYIKPRPILNTFLRYLVQDLGNIETILFVSDQGPTMKLRDQDRIDKFFPLLL